MVAAQQSKTVLGGPIYFPQLDLLKGGAIISVILLHTLPRSMLVTIFAHFHIWQAVPIFFILLGITLAISFSRREADKIRQVYSKSYLLSRVDRVVIPFIVIFLASLTFGLFKGDFYIGWLYILGRLPVIGNGNYFASILLQYIFISPLIFFFYRKSPRASIATLFLLELLFQLLTPYISVFQQTKYLYSACIFRYLSAIAIGLHISDDLLVKGRIHLLDRKNLFILVGFPISIVYLLMARTTAQPFPLFWNQSNFQNLISFFYPTVLVALIMNWRFQHFNNWFFKATMIFGKASYHIFLVQILYFGFGLNFIKFVTIDNYLIWGPLAIILNLLINIILGLLFYLAQGRIEERLKRKRINSFGQAI
jgi:peptidoglycan/LPS O-acetylase OafA/YrhL